MKFLKNKIFRLILKYKFTIIFSILSILALIIALNLGDLQTGPEVFLPGYKAGMKIEDIEDETVKNLIRVEKKFGDRLSVMVIIKNEDTFLKEGSLERVKELQSGLEKLEGIKSILSVLNLPKITGLTISSYVNGNNLDESVLKDPNASSLISKDGKYLILNCVLEVKANPKEVTKKLKNYLKNFEELSPLIFGEPAIDQEMFSELLKQTFVYPVFMFLAILLVFYFQTRSFRASVIALLLPLIATLYVFAIFFLIGGVLNILTVMVTSFLMIIGSAYGLHYYNAVHRHGKEAARNIFIPIFFSMATTAVGFLSFLFVKISAFRELGIMVSSGLLIVVGLLFTAGKELLNDEGKNPRSLGVKYLGDRTSRIFFMIALIVLAAFPFTALKINIGADSIQYFSKKSDIRKAYNVMEKEFGFREPLFVMIEKKNANFLMEDMENLKTLKEELESVQGIARVEFPIDIPIPIAYLLSRNQEFLKYFISSGNTIRFMIYVSDEGFKKIGELKKVIDEILKKYPYDSIVAGSSLIWDKINSEVLLSQLQSLIAAGLLIFAMVYIIFRKLKFSLVVMIPLSFTVAMNFIFMYLFQLNLEISTAIISSILMGLIIDYSIHLAYDSKKTGDPLLSLKRVGPSILANALGLISGFAVLLFSTFALFKNVSLLLILGISYGLIFTIIVESWFLKILLKDRN